MTEHFARIVNGYFRKRSIKDVRLGSKYTSVHNYIFFGKKANGIINIFGHPKFSDRRKNGAALDNTYRSSHGRCSVWKGVLRIFSKFTGKHLKPETLLKKRLWHRCFPVNFVKFLRTPPGNWFSSYEPNGPVYRGGSRTAATSMERFVIIVNGFQPLTIITKRSILDVAVVLDAPLVSLKLI